MLPPARLGRWSATACRLFLGLLMFTGGAGKLIPFPGVMGPVWLEERLAPHGLALFARFVAWSELGIGLLLLSRRYATLGAIMLVPLLANMLAVTISQGWRGTPWVLSVFLAMNLYLLARDSHRWKFLLALDDGPLRATRPPLGSPRSEAWSLGAVLLCLAGFPLHAVEPWVGYAAIVAGLSGAMIPAPRPKASPPAPQPLRKS